jgi:hypothetical protein
MHYFFMALMGVIGLATLWFTFFVISRLYKNQY